MSEPPDIVTINDRHYQRGSEGYQLAVAYRDAVIERDSLRVTQDMAREQFNRWRGLLVESDALLSLIRWRESRDGLSEQTIRDLNDLLPRLRHATSQITRDGLL